MLGASESFQVVDVVVEAVPVLVVDVDTLGDRPVDRLVEATVVQFSPSVLEVAFVQVPSAAIPYDVDRH
jgi:hypothetical protein